ncbi:MAG: ArsR family transcriptional regulator, partial [Calditrichaeota bacterium]
MYPPPPPLVIKEEDTQFFDGHRWHRDNTYYIQIFDAMVSSGLLATIEGTGLKILIAIGLAASPLGVGSPEAEAFFNDLVARGIVHLRDRGRLFCHLPHDELCARVGISKNTLTAHTRKLVAAGLIERREIKRGSIHYNIFFIQPASHLDKYNTYHADKASSPPSEKDPSVPQTGTEKQADRPKNWDDTVPTPSQIGTNLRKDSFPTTTATPLEDFENFSKTALTHFARRKGTRRYRPTAHDREWLVRLYRQGCSRELVRAAID